MSDETPTTWQERVSAEADALETKIAALQAFLNRKDKEELVSAGQIVLMSRQLVHMKDYYERLNDRLALDAAENADEAEAGETVEDGSTPNRLEP